MLSLSLARTRTSPPSGHPSSSSRQARAFAMFRRLGQAALRTARPRGGHGWPGGSFWSEGTQEGKNGLLFGETHRKVESWELIT